MNNVTCCGKVLKGVYNMEDLWRSRHDGMPEDEAHEFALRGFLCGDCLTWYEENDSGKMFVIHLPSNEEVE